MKGAATISAAAVTMSAGLASLAQGREGTSTDTLAEGPLSDPATGREMRIDSVILCACAILPSPS